MTTTMTITSWNNDKRGYARADSHRAPVEPENRMNYVVSYLENLVSQLRHFSGPEGITFGSWRGRDNKDANFIEAHALALDYHVDRFEELVEAAERLGYARIWMTGEDKARSINTIALIIPFSAPATKAQYERIASCIAKELDVYSMVGGALAVNHIINCHATTLTGFERGEVLDPAAFIARTKDLYQRRDAKKYHALRRPCRAADVHTAPPEVSGCGLFQW